MPCGSDGQAVHGGGENQPHRIHLRVAVHRLRYLRKEGMVTAVAALVFYTEYTISILVLLWGCDLIDYWYPRPPLLIVNTRYIYISSALVLIVEFDGVIVHH